MHIHISAIFRYRLRPEWLHRPVFHAVYPHLNSVVGVSQSVSRDLAEDFHLENVRCIPNSIDLEEISRLARDTSTTVAAVPFASPLIVAVGVLDFQKGFDVLIAAHARVRAAGVLHQLVIAGKGNLEEDLRRLAEREGVKDSVHFVGFLKNPYPLMARATGFVLSSRLEGFALVVAEALALGVPVIATNVAGPDEILDGGRYGPLVPVDDITAMAEAMKRLLTDGEWHAALARTAPEAAERYDVRRIVPRIEALFDEVLGAAG